MCEDKVGDEEFRAILSGERSERRRHQVEQMFGKKIVFESIPDAEQFRKMFDPKPLPTWIELPASDD